jgi:hypothetical protein
MFPASQIRLPVHAPGKPAAGSVMAGPQKAAMLPATYGMQAHTFMK